VALIVVEKIRRKEESAKTRKKSEIPSTDVDFGM
jgi:hypothetical protein